jgi:hypothetical protein
LLVNDLQRLLQAFPDKSGSQYGVTLERLLPSVAQGCGIEIALDLEADLRAIDAGAGRVQGMEQQALLHRGQRINIFDVLELHVSPVSGQFAAALLSSFATLLSCS